MFSSERSSSSSFLLSPLTNQNTLNKISTDGEFLKSREFNGSDFFQNQNQSQQSSGLARYKSAPSSFLAALLDSNNDNSSSGDESEAFFSALIDGPNKNSDNHHHHHHQQQQHQMQQQYSVKQDNGPKTELRPGFVNGQMGGFVGSYSMGMESQVHVRLSDNGNRNLSNNLVRQSSSPAGFFNGFGVMGEVGNYRVHNHAEASSSALNLSNQMSFSSAPSSSSRFMPSIPEIVNESIPTNTPENVRLRNDGNCSWSESTFNPLKRGLDSDLKMFSNFNGLENQNGESRKKSSGLVSHLSLPKTNAEMAVVENILHFQQETTTIPCQIRAKRGFATHPRSIAERMRRNRISDNMKKLQDLFPNMDKQTNTAEMLDLAVDYIKDLQKQVQTLTDTKARCVCSNKPQQTSPEDDTK